MGEVTAKPIFDTVTLVGIGLIGSSLARVMRQAMDPPDSNVVFEHRVLKQNGQLPVVYLGW
ncbi:MAG: hypothetical protein HC779_05595 [Phyllobacteriaceae bacterium]|nr:hypothetical protein [Phyllobacteriaceae bacterium]